MAGDNQSDRAGDSKAGELTRVIDGASNSAMDEVLDAWGPPPKSKSRDLPDGGYELERHGEHGEKVLLKASVEEQEQPNESLDTDQIGMMALSGHEFAQAADEMLKTPAAQDKKVRDGIKKDVSAVLADWFKERFQDVTNAVSGFDKWVTSTFNSKNLRGFGEGIRKAAFGHHEEAKPETASKIDGNFDDFKLKGVESPQDVAEYGVSTAVGATKALSHAAPLLTPQGFAKTNHELAEGGRKAIKNAAEYYGEHGLSTLPTDTADATKTAYDRLGQWSSDRMQMEPGERGDTTGSAMAMMFFLIGQRKPIKEDVAKKMGLDTMSEAQLRELGIERGSSHWNQFGRTTEESVARKVEGYLLKPEHVKADVTLSGKAQWFEQNLGFTKENMDDLIKQIKFDPEKAVPTALTEHGQKYTQLIELNGANGITREVPFVFIKNHDGIVRLVTVPKFPKAGR